MLYVLILLLASTITQCQSQRLSSGADICGAPEDGDLIATMFLKCGPHLYDRSNCPTETWLVSFREADLAHKKKQVYTIINIGFNKGYNFATWMNAFTPSYNVDAWKWSQALERVPELKEDRYICGQCGDCRTPSFNLPVVEPEPQLRFVGVDLNGLNIVAVNKTMELIRAEHKIPEDKVTLALIHAAGGVGNLGETPTLVKVPKCTAGDEICQIASDPTALKNISTYDLVPVMPVDKLIRDMHMLRSPHHHGNRPYFPHHAAHGLALAGNSGSGSGNGNGGGGHRAGSDGAAPLTMIDILQIDTEGHDPEVIKSARYLLHHRRLRALMFEYNRPWGETKLQDVVKEITKQDMMCYFAGTGRLWPISHSCWRDRYEFKLWSNVLCVLKSDPWYAAIQPLVVTADYFRSKLKEGDLVKANRQPQVYLVRNGTLQGFATGEALTRRGYSFESVRSMVPCEISDILPHGPQLT